MTEAPLSEIEAAKRAARAAARAVRDAAQAASPGAPRRAAGHMLGAIAGWRGKRLVAAYLPIGSELDTRPLMMALHGLGFTVAVPVVVARAEPLRFRCWRPGAPLAAGPFGVQVPVEGDWCTPEVMVVPLLAFDAGGWRLGYGGGFYDRTLAAGRAAGPVTAVGYGYAAQEVAAVPRDALDARLDAVVTEAGILRPR